MLPATWLPAPGPSCRPGPTAAEEKHLATLAKPRMVNSQVQLCVYSALHMDHLSRGGSFASATPRRSASPHSRSRSGLGTSLKFPGVNIHMQNYGQKR